MENQKTNSSLKAVIAVLALLLAGSLYYIFSLTNETKELTTQVTTIKTEKENVLDSLAVLKATYDKAIEENTAMSEELKAERAKIETLMADVKKSKGDAASMRKYKEQYTALQSNMKVLMAENEELKKQNKVLTTQRDSTIVVLGEQRKANDTLTAKNTNLSKTVEKASKLVILNLKTQGIKQKKSGKQIETDKASKANRLKICFTIAENSVAKSGEKTYYVQIIDSKNNIVGENKKETFGTFILNYSFTTKVAYANKTVDICELIGNTEKDFEKGTYFVNIFDKSELVSKTSFNLR